MPPRYCLVRPIGDIALYTSIAVASGFDCHFTFFCTLARRNVIDVSRAPADVNGVLPPRIDETEALPYKPPQLSDIPAETANATRVALVVLVSLPLPTLPRGAGQRGAKGFWLDLKRKP
jgi:hypothetical protein